MNKILPVKKQVLSADRFDEAVSLSHKPVRMSFDAVFRGRYYPMTAA